MMNRRTFLGTLAGGLLAAPLAAAAQPTGKARVGILSVGANPRSASFYAAFEQRLRELGHIDGQTLIIDFRAPSKGEDLSQVADNLVRQRPDVLLVAGPEVSIKAATRATRTIPIVMVALNYDPIALGYVQSLARPGGNITGLVSRAVDTAPKQLELLREALPAGATVAVLWESPVAADLARSVEAAALSLGVRLQKVEVRRRFISGIAFGLLARPLAVGAQQVGRVYRIGILEPIPAAQNAANLEALRKGLRDHGYVEGRNLIIEYRSADGRAERFPDLASELVRLKVDLIVTRGTPATRAAKNATGSIPVVIATMGEPHAIVASFAHPGGNITGVTTFSTELTAKRIEILRELRPSLSRVALLHNMGNPAAPPEWEETKMAARALGVHAELLDVRSQGDFGRAFEQAVRQHVDALVIGHDGLTQMHQQTIVDLVARNRLPAVYPAREFVEAGGLMAYAVNYPDLYFRFASFVDKIFKGAKPSDLPVERPTKFELVISLKTAKALGLTIPQALLLRADQVIEQVSRVPDVTIVAHRTGRWGSSHIERP